MDVVSFFAGCGGLDLGFEQAGFNVVWANELEPHCRATYIQNHPNTTFVLGDERGQLFLKYIELINAKQPKFFVIENVKGMLDTKFKNVFDDFVKYNISQKCFLLKQNMD